MKLPPRVRPDVAAVGHDGRVTENAAQSDVAEVLAAREREVREQAATLAEQLEGLVEAAAGANADDEHDPEGATLAYEREQVAALLRNTEEELAELAAARARLAEGTYGTCEVCGGPIAPARLEARPTARTCITCASARR